MFHLSGLSLLDCFSRFLAVLLVVVCLQFNLQAEAAEHVYVPYSGIIEGTEGADPVQLSVSNSTDSALRCTAALAHWYSEELGEIAPGLAMNFALWHDPETGVLNLMNTTNDRMPIEAIWCGTSGNLSATRTRLVLPNAIGPAPARIAPNCTVGSGQRLNCSDITK